MNTGVAALLDFRDQCSDNERVIELTEPQVWVLMGIFATAIFGMLGWQTASVNRNLAIVRDSLRESIESLGKVMDVRFSAQDARFAAIEKKIDDLDRDVQAISRHVFGADPH